MMFTPQMNWTVFRWSVPWLTAVGLVIGSAPAWATDISWRTNSTMTANQGAQYEYQGTAVFATGDDAHVVGKGTRGENSSSASGTSTVEAIYTFNDGSSFTVRFLSAWNGPISRNAGIFINGTGRFVGMIGAATAAAAPKPASGPAETVWTGTYELAPK